MMRNCFIFVVTLSALCGARCFGENYVARDFISPKTGKSTIFWGETSKGKDAYVVEYDEKTDHYYFEKIEKNKPQKKTDRSENKIEELNK